MEEMQADEQRVNEQQLGLIRERAQALIDALGTAQDAGLSQALILPELVAVFREAGVLP